MRVAVFNALPIPLVRKCLCGTETKRGQGLGPRFAHQPKETFPNREVLRVQYYLDSKKRIVVERLRDNDFTSFFDPVD